MGIYQYTPNQPLPLGSLFALALLIIVPFIPFGSIEITYALGWDANYLALRLNGLVDGKFEYRGVVYFDLLRTPNAGQNLNFLLFSCRKAKKCKKATNSQQNLKKSFLTLYQDAGRVLT